MADTFELWLQSRLTAHKFPVGAIDGKIGPTTIKAIRAFQASHGMEPTGRADGQTVALLKAPSSTTLPEVRRELPNRDLDETPVQSLVPSLWPRQDDCMAFYGPVGQNQTQIDVPFDFWLAWDKTTRVTRISVHEKVAASAQHCFERIPQIYTATERHDLGLDLFGGSLNVRRMRGGSKYSMHSWGIAIDFDPERNQLHWHKPQARLSHPDAVPFWMIWESQGWVSLGRARGLDWMHIQAARL